MRFLIIFIAFFSWTLTNAQIDTLNPLVPVVIHGLDTAHIQNLSIGNPQLVPPGIHKVEIEGWQNVIVEDKDFLRTCDSSVFVMNVNNTVFDNIVFLVYNASGQQINQTGVNIVGNSDSEKNLDLQNKFFDFAKANMDAGMAKIRMRYLMSTETFASSSGNLDSTVQYWVSNHINFTYLYDSQEQEALKHEICKVQLDSTLSHYSIVIREKANSAYPFHNPDSVSIYRNPFNGNKVLIGTVPYSALGEGYAFVDMVTPITSALATNPERYFITEIYNNKGYSSKPFNDGQFTKHTTLETSFDTATNKITIISQYKINNQSVAIDDGNEILGYYLMGSQNGTSIDTVFDEIFELGINLIHINDSSYQYYFLGISRNCSFYRSGNDSIAVLTKYQKPSASNASLNQNVPTAPYRVYAWGGQLIFNSDSKMDLEIYSIDGKILGKYNTSNLVLTLEQNIVICRISEGGYSKTHKLINN